MAARKDEGPKQNLPEDGPESWVPTNRCLMEEKGSAAFKLVDSKWDDYFKQ